MTTVVFVRRFLADYARNPVNPLVLVLVPTVFVLVASGSMADAARLLGGTGPAVETATAGWAAGFMAGIAMYFQTRAARAADHRLVLAGLPALVALASRTGIDDLWRVVAGILMFAVIYLAIGAVTGALVRNPVNGTVLISFVWIMDVFFGPAVASADRIATRWLPTHFVTLWMVDLPSRHGGRIGDLGWALVWLIGAAIVAAVVVTTVTRASRHSRKAAPGSAWAQFATGLRLGLRDYRRNPVLWALLIVVPVVFIWLSKVITPDEFMVMSLSDDGRATTFRFWLPDMHAGTMTPIAIASLATLAGLFVVLDARTGDHRLLLAGYRPAALLLARLGVILTAVALVAVVSLTVTALVFDARQPLVYVGGNLLLAITYALLGVCLGPVFGRVSGVLIAFLVPFLDIGVAQSPMLRPEPAAWARYLPGYGADRVLLDGGLTGTFDEAGALLLALGWVVLLGGLAAWLFRHPASREGSA